MVFLLTFLLGWESWRQPQSFSRALTEASPTIMRCYLSCLRLPLPLARQLQLGRYQKMNMTEG